MLSIVAEANTYTALMLDQPLSGSHLNARPRMIHKTKATSREHGNRS